MECWTSCCGSWSSCSCCFSFSLETLLHCSLLQCTQLHLHESWKWIGQSSIKWRTVEFTSKAWLTVIISWENIFSVCFFSRSTFGTRKRESLQCTVQWYLSIQFLLGFVFINFLSSVFYVSPFSEEGCICERAQQWWLLSTPLTPPPTLGWAITQQGLNFVPPQKWPFKLIFQNSRAPRGQPYRPTRWDVFFIKTLHQTKLSRLALLQPLSMLLGASNKAKPVH